MKQTHLGYHWWIIPLVGIAVYVLLYVAATYFYPGGSNANRASVGFDWVNNYWCDLIARTAKNGEPNGARKMALTGMVILVSSLSVFWYQLPSFFRERKTTRILIRVFGITAMIVLLFVTSTMHDVVISIGGLLSAVPVFGLLKELYANGWSRLFFWGTLCVALIVANFFIYLTGLGIVWLPLIQKITFVCFLSWIWFIVVECRSVQSKKEAKYGYL